MELRVVTIDCVALARCRASLQGGHMSVHPTSPPSSTEWVDVVGHMSVHPTAPPSSSEWVCCSQAQCRQSSLSQW
jgi:hypothetical protein